jgi:hypothetical protein
MKFADLAAGLPVAAHALPIPHAFPLASEQHADIDAGSGRAHVGASDRREPSLPLLPEEGLECTELRALSMRLSIKASKNAVLQLA